MSFIHERYRRCGGFIAHSSREEAFEEAARAARGEEQEQIAKGGFTAPLEGAGERKVQRRRTDVKTAHGGGRNAGR